MNTKDIQTHTILYTGQSVTFVSPPTAKTWHVTKNPNTQFFRPFNTRSSPFYFRSKGQPLRKPAPKFDFIRDFQIFLGKNKKFFELNFIFLTFIRNHIEAHLIMFMAPTFQNISCRSENVNTSPPKGFDFFYEKTIKINQNVE